MNVGREMKTANFKCRFPDNGRFANMQSSMPRADSACCVVGAINGDVDHCNGNPSEIPLEVLDIAFIFKGKGSADKGSSTKGMSPWRILMISS